MIEKYVSDDYEDLVNIWESSVKHTHKFLKEEDFIKIKKEIKNILKSLLIYTYSYENKIVCFAGIAGDNLEALFCHKDYIGKGFGKKLIDYVIKNLNIKGYVTTNS